MIALNTLNSPESLDYFEAIGKLYGASRKATVTPWRQNLVLQVIDNAEYYFNVGAVSPVSQGTNLPTTQTSVCLGNWAFSCKSNDAGGTWLQLGVFDLVDSPACDIFSRGPAVGLDLFQVFMGSVTDMAIPFLHVQTGLGGTTWDVHIWFQGVKIQL